MPTAEDAFVDGLADALAKGKLRDALMDVAGMVVSQQRRIKQLEAEMPRSRGLWLEGQTYKPADLVTSGGSAWVCREATSSRPSTRDPSWQIFVTHGRDGKSK